METCIVKQPSIWILIPPFPKRTLYFYVLTLLMIWKISRGIQSGLFQIVRRWKLRENIIYTNNCFLGLVSYFSIIGRSQMKIYNYEIICIWYDSKPVSWNRHSFLFVEDMGIIVFDRGDLWCQDTWNMQEAKRTIRWYSSKNRKGWWLKTENRKQQKQYSIPEDMNLIGRMI